MQETKTSSAFKWTLAIVGVVFIGSMLYIANHDFTGTIVPVNQPAVIQPQ